MKINKYYKSKNYAVKAYSEDHSKYLFSSRLILETIGNYIFRELTEFGIKCQKPQGGFYMLCNFSKVRKIIIALLKPVELTAPTIIPAVAIAIATLTIFSI